MPFCTNCGNNLDTNTKFCENCGNPVTLQKKQLDEAPAKENYNDFETFNQNQTFAYNSEPTSNYDYTNYNGNQGNNQFNPYEPPVFVRPKAKYTFVEAIQNVFKHYIDFNGRAVKSEYWYFFLFNTIVGGVLSFLAGKSGLFGALSLVYSIAVIIPNFTVTVRRLHDVGKSGMYMLMYLIPLVGVIMVIYQLAQDSAPDNEYGLAAEAPFIDNNSFYQN